MIKTARVIAITSGKGGVGKTHICANLGILLAQQGLRTCIVDADHGLANINLILGLKTSGSPAGLFDEDSALAQAMVTTPEGLDILPAATGLSQKIDQPAPTAAQLKRLFQRLRALYDIILIDTAAGIEQGVRNYLLLADHVVLTITPEPTSLTDGFGLVRVMSKTHRCFEVITNRVSDAAAANEIYRRFSRAIKKYIGVDTSLLGYIGEDPYVCAAILAQTVLVSYRPGCPASRSLERISLALFRKLNYSRSESKPGNQNRDDNAFLQTTNINRVTKPIPASPSFIRTKTKVDPFTNWLVQIDDFLTPSNTTAPKRQQRYQQLLKRLKPLGDQDSLLKSTLDDFIGQQFSASEDKESSLARTNAIPQSIQNCSSLSKQEFVPAQSLNETGNQLPQPVVTRACAKKGAERVLGLISQIQQKPYISSPLKSPSPKLASSENEQ